MAEHQAYTGEYDRKIVKANTTDKVIDFSDGLVLSSPKYYAMLQGNEGQKGMPRSGIKVSITNTNKDKPSVYASALAPCYIFEILKNVCLQNMGQKGIGPGGLCKDITDFHQGLGYVKRGLGCLAENVNRVSSNLYTTLSGAVRACADIINDTSTSSGAKAMLSSFGKNIKQARNSFVPPVEIEKNNGADDNSPPLSIDFPAYTDYYYRQERVNIHDKRGDRCHVSTLEFRRVNFRNTAKSKMPWCITISNFYARTSESKNGTIQYSSSGDSVVERKDAFISLTDEEMFRCCYAVEHFISVWEVAMCLEQVGAAGLARRDAMLRNRGNGPAGTVNRNPAPAAASAPQAASASANYSASDDGYYSGTDDFCDIMAGYTE